MTAGQGSTGHHSPHHRCASPSHRRVYQRTTRPQHSSRGADRDRVRRQAASCRHSWRSGQHTRQGISARCRSAQDHTGGCRCVRCASWPGCIGAGWCEECCWGEPRHTLAARQGSASLGCGRGCAGWRQACRGVPQLRHDALEVRVAHDTCCMIVGPIHHVLAHVLYRHACMGPNLQKGYVHACASVCFCVCVCVCVCVSTGVQTVGMKMTMMMTPPPSHANPYPHGRTAYTLTRQWPHRRASTQRAFSVAPHPLC